MANDFGDYSSEVRSPGHFLSINSAEQPGQFDWVAEDQIPEEVQGVKSQVEKAEDPMRPFDTFGLDQLEEERALRAEFRKAELDDFLRPFREVYGDEAVEKALAEQAKEVEEAKQARDIYFKSEGFQEAWRRLREATSTHHYPDDEIIALKTGIFGFAAIAHTEAFVEAARLAFEHQQSE